MSGFSLDLVRLTESYALCLGTEGKNQKTITWYIANLNRFANFLKKNNFSISVSDIGKEQARQFITYLQNDVVRWEENPSIHDDKPLSAYSVQGYVRTIKAFWSWLLIEEYITHNRMAGLKLPRTPRKVVHTFSHEQIQKLLGVIDTKHPTGFRNYTMILLLLDTGIRLSELIGLKIDDIDFLQSYITVKGKGNKERVVPIGSHVRRILRRYTMHFRPELDSPRTREVFLSEDGLSLRPRAVQSMLKRLGRKAKLSGTSVNPHRFRHTFAREFLINGGDIFSLQKILGHSSLEVVKMYINLMTNDILDQHRKFSPVDNSILPRR